MLRRKPQVPISRIEMSPLAGILICLVAAFAMTTPLPLFSCGVDIDLPRLSSAWPTVEETPGAISVGMTRGSSMYFRGVRLENGIPEFRDRLRSYLAENPEVKRVVQLRADVEIPFATIAELIAACRNAGATGVRLVGERLD